MIAILKKEFNIFFSSVLGYLIIVLFLISLGLFLWVFDSSFNIFNSGYANLTPFFELLPWVFIFLIPAICMRSFSEERKQGTIELLFTKPISTRALVYGKFWGAFLLAMISLIPTIGYVWTISSLKQYTNQIDLSAIITSYMGVCLMLFALISLSIFSSVLSKNQITAFILAVFFNLLLFYGFYGLSNFKLLGSEVYALEYLSLNFHYKAMSRGVIDTRNLIYFLSIAIIFNEFTRLKLNQLKA